MPERIDWTKPLRVKKTGEPAVLVRVMEKSRRNPYIVQIDDTDCYTYDEYGRWCADGETFLDIENVPEVE